MYFQSAYRRVLGVVEAIPYMGITHTAVVGLGTVLNMTLVLFFDTSQRSISSLLPSQPRPLLELWCAAGMSSEEDLWIEEGPQNSRGSDDLRFVHGRPHVNLSSV